MTIEKKLLGTSPSGGATDVADVFSTYLYTGTGSTRSINNGIDLAGEGGMTWVKRRTNGSYSHQILDTERSASDGYNALSSNTTGADNFTYGWGFNSDGFTINGGAGTLNVASEDYASWTFRKKEKFFDIVTYTGNGATNRKIAHSLDGAVGMMLVKARTTSGVSDASWYVWHRSLTNTTSNYLVLNTTVSEQASNNYFTTAPSSTEFTVGNNSGINANGATYVAYLFADNSSEDAEEQMIKCGSFTSSSANQAINLGWEPQFVLIKSSSNNMSWYIFDTMRGIVTSGNDSILAPNDALVEETATQYLEVTPTGFISHFNALAGSRNYIFMAIRAENMVEPEAATNVFAIAAADSTIPQHNSSFPVDMAMKRNVNVSDGMSIGARMVGTRRMLSSTAAAETTNANNTWDFMDGWSKQASANAAVYSWMWKRAKGYMDVVAYSGNSTTNRAIPHSLGVAPEMIWVKSRTAAENWNVLVPSIIYSNTGRLTLNENGAAEGGVQHYWGNGTNYVAPTGSNFTVSTGNAMNGSGKTYIAYLFATLAGISKVGSYTGNGSSQTINCGFSAGARFILIKRTNAAGDWYVWDSVRGIVAGNDPHLSLNTTAAQVTNDDSIDPANAGFIVNQVSATNINVSSATYVFYAIA